MFWKEIPALYDVARNVCHEFGLPWTDPRTGITYPPPKSGRRRRRSTAPDPAPERVPHNRRRRP